MPSKRTRWIVAGVAVVVVGGAAFFAWNRRPKPTPVQLATVGREDLQAKVTANGKVQAQREGRHLGHHPGPDHPARGREGDAVKKGQFLLQIDAANPRAAARSTRVLDAGAAAGPRLRPRHPRPGPGRRRARRRATTRPASSPRPSSSAPAPLVGTAEAALLATEQRVEQARADARRARATRWPRPRSARRWTASSPPRRVEEGEVAVIGVQNSPGTVLLTISDMSVVETEMEVDETSIPSVAVGQEARCASTPTRTRPSTAWSPRWAARRSSAPTPARPRRSSSRSRSRSRTRRRDQARPLGAGRHPHRLPPQALAVPIQALVIRETERKPGETPKPGDAARRGGRLGGRQAARWPSRPIKTGLLGELSLEVIDGPRRAARPIVTGPFRALRTLKAGDAVREEKAARAGRATPPREGLTMAIRGARAHRRSTSLRAHKLRSFLTLLGIIIGVTTLVGVASVISGLNAYVQDQVIQLAPDVFVVTKFGIIRSRDEFLDALKRPDLELPRLRDAARPAAPAPRRSAPTSQTGAAVKPRAAPPRRHPGARHDRRTTAPCSTSTSRPGASSREPTSARARRSR